MSTKRNILWLFAAMLLAASGTLKAEWSEPFFHVELNDPGIASGTNPFLSEDGLTIYYSRHRANENTYDLAEAYRDTPDGLFTSKRIISELYTGNKQMSPWVSSDQLRLYYAEDVGGEMFIRLAERSSTDDTWTHVRTFDEIHTDGFNDLHPTLIPDELTIFWTKAAGAGNKHVYMATRISINDPFTGMTELTELYDATDGNVAGPCILNDGLTIYFSSKHETPEACIYRATRSSTDEPFGDIQLLEFCDPEQRESSPYAYIMPDEKAVYYRGDLTGWGIYVRYWLEEPYETAIRNIEEAIGEKTKAIEVIEAAMDKEMAALEALQELTASGEYGELGLRRIDIFRARIRIMLSMLRQRRARAELRKGIRELERALVLLGADPAPQGEAQVESSWPRPIRLRIGR